MYNTQLVARDSLAVSVPAHTLLAMCLQMARETLGKVPAPRLEVQLVHIKELCANIWVCHPFPALNVF